MNEQDNEIRNALINKATEIAIPETMYLTIKTALANKMEETQAGGKPSYLYFKKIAAVGISLLIILMLAVLSFPNDIRAAATEVVNTVKTIFIVEKEENAIKILEIPMDQLKSSASHSEETELSDEEISKKLGYTVAFPKFLEGNYKLHHKNLGVSITKSIGYSRLKSMQETLSKAINDNNRFESLKKYDPYFTASAVYVNSKNLDIYVSVSPQDKLRKLDLKGLKPKKVQAGEFTGYWAQIPLPLYPKMDETQKPDKIIKDYYCLFIEKGGLRYNISGIKLSLTDAKKFTKSFIENQNNESD